ncbi:hypothetical protein EX30DRAFT_350952 [Ascodesmis nigricans]|uniref:Uncharacterized protein n=1 Tax=Ascodesmis nigricans TaxID=341454 RepID=A0A4S2MN57_9PEZI|nr:hypothetical protein EX30DRAFT_350952 [Ascodesmis nigricans]
MLYIGVDGTRGTGVPYLDTALIDPSRQHLNLPTPQLSPPPYPPSPSARKSRDAIPYPTNLPTSNPRAPKRQAPSTPEQFPRNTSTSTSTSQHSTAQHSTQAAGLRAGCGRCWLGGWSKLRRNYPGPHVVVKLPEYNTGILHTVLKRHRSANLRAQRKAGGFRDSGDEK